jgi:RNA polymerase sigma-32 factor
MLTPEEETRLLDAYLDHNDIEARNKLMTSYMPMVTKAARAFAERGTAPLSDLVQEGALGLSEAIDKFKRDKNSRVSTLATYYIKARLIRYAMEYSSGDCRVGTNLPDKKVYMNLRRMVSEIQSKNGGVPITDADRADIARQLGVKVTVVERMEPRVFANDVAISHTDAMPEDRDGCSVTSAGIIAVEGDQYKVDCASDQATMMLRIQEIVQQNYSARDLEIVTERIRGDMTREKYDHFVSKYNITVERIRQIQRGALELIHKNLVQDGIQGLDDIAM